ncbi:MAG: HAD-IIIC family phosphatase [Aquisalimonadaceae bacterium]
MGTARSEIRQALKGASSWSQLLPVVQGLASEDVDGAMVDMVHRAVERLDGAADVRLAYLSDQTLDPLSRHVAAHAAMDGIRLGSYVGPYDQHFQEVLDPASGLAAFDPDVIFLNLSLGFLAPPLVAGFLDLSPDDRRAAITDVISHLRSWADAACERTRATLIIANFPRPLHPAAGIADSSLDCGEAEFHAELNLALLREFRSHTRVSVLDIDLVLARVGRERALNPRMAYLAKMPWDEVALPELSSELLRYVRAVRGDIRKCLVLDLDNTLWGGVVGEDGVWGVRVGDGDAESRAYADFQRVVKSLMRRGVVLAVCSKNNRDDVVELFEAREDMPLRWDDFATVRINWEHKHLNLQAIAEELNIGVDSLVFVDDNPVECEMVREMLPAVHTILLPEDPAVRPGLLRGLAAFETLRITGEDVAKLAQYRQNAARAATLNQAGDLTAFLEDLDTRVVLEQAAAQHVPRVHQLFMKTNQFNVTTQRYSVADVESFLDNPDCQLRVASVSDRFGDLGLVVQYLVRLDGEVGVIDSFLMSCRAMGRGIETALMNEIKRELLDSGRVQRLEARYVPTRKNAPVRTFFDDQGFERIEEDNEGNCRYRLDAAQAAGLACPGITVEKRYSEE